MIKTKPAELGLYPDDVEVLVVEAVAERIIIAPEGFTLKMAIGTSAFWLVGVTFLTSAVSQGGTMQSQVPYLDDIGFPVAMAATALGVAGLGSAIGKFCFGWLCDRIPPKHACLIGLGFQLSAIATIMNIEPASPMSMVWLYAVLMGLGMGSWLPTLSMLTSRNFGLASYGAIFGVMSLFQAVGVSIGPLVAGYLYDSMNTYHLAFIIFLAIYIITVPSILAVRRPK